MRGYTRRSSSSLGSDGFSLVELMVTVGLLGLVTLATSEFLKNSMKGAATVRNGVTQTNAVGLANMMLQSPTTCDIRLRPMVSRAAFLNSLDNQRVSPDRTAFPIPVTVLNKSRVTDPDIIILRNGMLDGASILGANLIDSRYLDCDRDAFNNCMTEYWTSRLRVTVAPRTDVPGLRDTAFRPGVGGNSVRDVPLSMAITRAAADPITQCSSDSDVRPGAGGLTSDKFAIFLLDASGGGAAYPNGATLVANQMGLAMPSRVAAGNNNTFISVNVGPNSVTVPHNSGFGGTIQVLVMGIPEDKAHRTYKFVDAGTYDVRDAAGAMLPLPLAGRLHFNMAFASAVGNPAVAVQPTGLNYSHSCTISCGTDGKWWVNGAANGVTPTAFNYTVTQGIDAGGVTARRISWIAVGDPPPGSWKFPVVNVGTINPGRVVVNYQVNRRESPLFMNSHNEPPRATVFFSGYYRRSCANNDGWVFADLYHSGARQAVADLYGQGTCGGGDNVTSAQWISIGD